MFLKASDPGAYALVMGGRRYPVRGGVFLVSADTDPLLVETFQRVDEVPDMVAAELSELGNWPVELDGDHDLTPPPAAEAVKPVVAADDLDEISDEQLLERVMGAYPMADPAALAAAIARDRPIVVEDLRNRIAQAAGNQEDTDDDEEETGTTLEQRIDQVKTHADANALAAELGLSFEEKKPGVEAKKTALREAAASA